MYDFATQLELGKQVEKALDEYFGRWYDIQSVDLRDEVNQGIDRIYTNKQTGERRTVEYKADFKAFATGNAYVELSVNSDNGYSKDGWAKHSKADLILYVVVCGTLVRQIFVIKPDVIQYHLSDWQNVYRHVKCFNKSYHSVGLLVPLSIIEGIAYRSYSCRFQSESVTESFVS